MNGKVEIKQFLPFMKHKQQDTLGIYTLEEFRAVLKHERARADRDGSEFSLVVFEVGSVDGKIIDTRGMVRALGERIRSIDEVGWVDDESIGVLLPSTNLEGGWIFVVDFESKIYTKKSPPPFTVYSYPNQWFQNNGETGGTSQKQTEKKLKQKNISNFITNSNLDDINPSIFSKTKNDFALKKEETESIIVKKVPLWKRTMDIVGSILGLILFSPLFLIITVYIKIVSPGPVLFKQKRIGYKGRAFTFLKFRTMKIGNNQVIHKKHSTDFIHSDVSMEKLDNKGDPRIIPGGRILRKTCLDESPQFINILRGEMSLVGPRPCIPYEAQEYLRWHKHRFDVVPGLSGLWQVSGKNKLTFKKMVRLDIHYIENMSFWLDVKILLLTIPVIIGMVFEAVMKKIRVCEKIASQYSESNVSICKELEAIAQLYQ